MNFFSLLLLMFIFYGQSTLNPSAAAEAEDASHTAGSITLKIQILFKKSEIVEMFPPHQELEPTESKAISDFHDVHFAFKNKEDFVYIILADELLEEKDPVVEIMLHAGKLIIKVKKTSKQECSLGSITLEKGDNKALTFKADIAAVVPSGKSITDTKIIYAVIAHMLGKKCIVVRIPLEGATAGL